MHSVEHCPSSIEKVQCLCTLESIVPMDVDTIFEPQIPPAPQRLY